MLFYDELMKTISGYCKVSSLPTVPHGSWSPATKVDFKGTATLTCEADYFSIGSVVKCEHNGQFKKTAEPNCVCKFTLYDISLRITVFSRCLMLYPSCFNIVNGLRR